jgi:hypothetical protein
MISLLLIAVCFIVTLMLAYFIGNYFEKRWPMMRKL